MFAPPREKFLENSQARSRSPEKTRGGYQPPDGAPQNPRRNSSFENSPYKKIDPAVNNQINRAMQSALETVFQGKDKKPERSICMLLQSSCFAFMVWLNLAVRPHRIFKKLVKTPKTGLGDLDATIISKSYANDEGIRDSIAIQAHAESREKERLRHMVYELEKEVVEYEFRLLIQYSTAIFIEPK